MDPLKLSTLAKLSGSAIRAGDAGRVASGVFTDTRKGGPGLLFVALKGERFDGNAFVLQAAELGAVGALVDPGFTGEVPSGFALLEAPDTLVGLQRLAAGYRRMLQLRVVGITGSSGKTSTKDMTAAVLSEKYRVASTLGNFNNHIGVPLTILAAGQEDGAGVFEVGMNHRGEIAPLAEIIAPEAAIITNIGTAHIENLGDRVEIAREKGDLISVVPEVGVAILGAEDDFVEHFLERARGKVVLTGIRKGDLRAENIRYSETESWFTVVENGSRAEARLPVLGEHMVRNALMAVAAGRWLRIPLERCCEALGRVKLSGGRLQRKEIGGVIFLDDSYNANPESTQAALRTLGGLSSTGSKIAVLGAMKELGGEAEAGHRRVGEVAGRAGLSLLICVGEEARWIAEGAAGSGAELEILEAVDAPGAAELLRGKLSPGDMVLVKGSRAMRMERVIQNVEGNR